MKRELNILLKAEACADVILNNSWEGNGHKSIVTKIGGVAFLSVIARNGITAIDTTICTIPIGYRPYATILAHAVTVKGISLVLINLNGEVKTIDATIPQQTNIQIISSWIVG